MSWDTTVIERENCIIKPVKIVCYGPFSAAPRSLSCPSLSSSSQHAPGPCPNMTAGVSMSGSNAIHKLLSQSQRAHRENLVQLVFNAESILLLKQGSYNLQPVHTGDACG